MESLTISYASTSPCAAPALRFGASAGALAPLPAAAISADAPFFFGNSAGAAYYFRARLTGLAPGQRYFYQVQTCGAWSALLSASTLPAGDDFRVLVWGDMGRDGGEQILPALEAEARAAAAGAPGSASFAVLVGDYAYNMDDKEGARGRSFMGRLSNVSAYLPSLMTIGSSFSGVPLHLLLLHAQQQACRRAPRLLAPTALTRPATTALSNRTAPLAARARRPRAGHWQCHALYQHPGPRPPGRQLWALVLPEHGPDPLGVPVL